MSSFCSHSCRRLICCSVKHSSIRLLFCLRHLLQQCARARLMLVLRGCHAPFIGTPPTPPPTTFPGMLHRGYSTSRHTPLLRGAPTSPFVRLFCCAHLPLHTRTHTHTHTHCTFCDHYPTYYSMPCSGVFALHGTTHFTHTPCSGTVALRSSMGGMDITS